MVDVHFPQFGTAVQGRVDFAWVQKMPRIKSAFNALLLFHIVLGKHLAHQVTLFYTDTVFTKPEHDLTEAYITGRFG